MTMPPGTRYMLGATLLFALVNVCIKKLADLPALLPDFFLLRS